MHWSPPLNALPIPAAKATWYHQRLAYKFPSPFALSPQPKDSSTVDDSHSKFEEPQPLEDKFPSPFALPPQPKDSSTVDDSHLKVEEPQPIEDDKGHLHLHSSSSLPFTAADEGLHRRMHWRSARQCHMRAMGQLSKEEGLEIPWQHKQAPLFYNHSDLDAVNRIARRAGKTVDHFTNLKPLGENTGEKFFSDYLFDEWARNQQGNRGTNSIRCMCELCGNNPVEITGQRVVFQTVDLPSPEPIADTTVHEVTSPIVQLDDAITKYMPRTLPIPKHQHRAS